MVAVAVATGLYLFWFDRPIPIMFYRHLDDRTIALDVDDGSAWDRVESVVETDTTVTVRLRSLIIPTIPSPAGLARTVEVVVTLEKPLGDRELIDGYSGTELRESCAPWLAGCPALPPTP